MDLNELLNPYRKKIIVQSIIKAVLLAVVVGLAVVAGSLGFVAVFKLVFDALNEKFMIIQSQTWATVIRVVTDLAGVGISFGIGLIAATITGLISFLSLRKKGMKNIAKKVDALGLHERVITMVEHQNDPSYVAYVQRQDAIEKVTTFDTSTIAINVPKSKIIASIALAVVIAILAPVVVFAIPIDAATPDEIHLNRTIESNHKLINDIQIIINMSPITDASTAPRCP